MHPKELQQIHDHVKEFAKQQGITEEEAERQLTEETLRGASDDFANVKENRVARAYLNQLQRMEDGQHLFGVLDRNSSEYKNSLINAQYVTPNKDLYNRVNRDSKNYATTTADYVLNAAIREGKTYYRQAGKEAVSQIYGHARAEANRYRDLERYHSEQESKQDQSLARKYSRQANSLTSAMAENYTSGTGLFSLKELYTNKDPLAKAMFENIAQSGYATGVGASLRAARNYSAKIPEEANANSKLPPVGEITDYKLIKVDFNQSLIKGSSESKLVNNLKSDTHYELSNGTKFKTNDYGHVEEISYSPVDMKMPRDKRQTLVGKEGLPTDVGGHIQACAHGGTCDRYNLFPQDANFNNSAYKKYFENIVSKALKEGKSVEVNTKFIRNDPSSARPDKLEIQFSVDGVKQSKIKFDNKGN